MTYPQRIGHDMAERKVLADIAEYGWHCTNILEDDGHPPWSFTIGFYETWSFPELIIIGRSRATSHEMLSRIAGDLEQNRGQDLATLGACIVLGIPCRPIEVAPHRYSDFVGFARWYYRGKQFPLYQLVWPSAEGHYPWDLEATEAFKAWQPVLGKPPPA
jgi:Domain of unknown function (DUF4262)